MTLFVQFFEIILNKFQSVKNRLIEVIFVDILKEFQFIILGNAWVQNDKSSSFFRILLPLNLKVKRIFFEVKMKLHLFFKEKRSHLESKMKMLALKGDKMVSKLSDNLIVLFLNRVLQLANYIKKFLSFEEFKLILLDMFFHLFGFVMIRKLLWKDFCELNQLFRRRNILTLLLYLTFFRLLVVVQTQEEIYLVNFVALYISLLRGLFYFFRLDGILFFLCFKYLFFVNIWLLLFLLLGFRFNLSLLFLVFLFIRRFLFLLCISLLFVVVLEFLLEFIQLFLLFGRMKEIALIAFATLTIEVEVAGLPIFLEVNKGAIIFPAGSSFEISAYFPSLHDQIIIQNIQFFDLKMGPLIFCLLMKQSSLVFLMCICSKGSQGQIQQAGPMVQRLAPWTLNPIIRVQISVGPFFLTLTQKHRKALRGRLREVPRVDILNLTSKTLIIKLCSSIAIKKNIIIINPSKMNSTGTFLSQPSNPTKIKTYECYSKFQEARPAYRSNLVNKQLGYDTIVEPSAQQESVKIKNCINSNRPNSELYKRISKTLQNNIKNNIDELILFTSLNAVARVETSIGQATNPGIFLIMGLSYLDEKYRDSYQKCDIEISFLEYRDGNMYDLLCYTNEILMPQRDGSGEFVDFREYWVKVTTFSQFIRMFKVALFNNKQRDFKTDNLNGKYKSTFIMKIRNKIYDENGEMTKNQETVLVDFQQNSMKQMTVNVKEKQGGKNLWDYILIDLHNGNPNNKYMHYHMVQDNYLLILLRRFLKKNVDGHGGDGREEKETAFVGGHVMLINVMPTQVESFPSCHGFLSNIIGTIGQSWEAKVAPKPKTRWHVDHRYVERELKGIVAGIAHNTYPSLRSFNQFKQKLMMEIRRCKGVVRELRRAISGAIRLKIQLSFMKNELMTYEMRLIGGCIKSDHFKDFYNAKSYIQLERQVSITTESIKEDIKVKLKSLEEAEKKFAGLRKRETELFGKYMEGAQKDHNRGKSIENIMEGGNGGNGGNLLSLQQTKENWHGRTSKFKKISLVKGESHQLGKLRKLINYLNQHMFALWDNYMMLDQRTVSNTVESEGSMLQDEQLLMDAICSFVTEIEDINDTDIMYEQGNNAYSHNEVGLFRSLNFLGLIGPKKNVKNYEVGKRLILKSKGKVRVNDQNRKTFPRFPSIHHLKSEPVIIAGKVKFSEMLTNPNSIANQIINSQIQ